MFHVKHFGLFAANNWKNFVVSRFFCKKVDFIKTSVYYKMVR